PQPPYPGPPPGMPYAHGPQPVLYHGPAPGPAHGPGPVRGGSKLIWVIVAVLLCGTAGAGVYFATRGPSAKPPADVRDEAEDDPDRDRPDPDKRAPDRWARKRDAAAPEPDEPDPDERDPDEPEASGSGTSDTHGTHGASGTHRAPGPTSTAPAPAIPGTP